MERHARTLLTQARKQLSLRPRSRTLTPFALSCLVSGLAGITYLELIK